MEIYAVTNISEYLQQIAQIRKKWKNNELWYRGVEDSAYQLTPSLYRGKYDIEGGEELDIYTQFIRRAKAFIPDYNKLNKLDWYIIMQHYSFPTRLLDWSLGSLIALFFAVKNTRVRHEKAVFIIDPFEVNSFFHNEEEVFSIDKFSSSEEKQQVKKYLPKVDLPEFPLAIDSPYIDKRIVSQKSCFTIHGNNRKPLEEIFTENNIKIAKIIIRNKDCKTIRTELNSAGISESILFPDLEGLAREMIYEYVIE